MKSIQTNLLPIAAVIGLIFGVWAITTTDVEAAPGDDKVSICHATGSSNNPYVVITVSVTAGDLTGALAKSGHFDPNGNPESGHEEDFFVEGDIPKSECLQPTPTPTPNPTPTPAPTGV